MQTFTPNRVAIVTGGSGGIGRIVAERLASDGLAVAVHYAGNKDDAQEVVDTITATGGNAMLVRGDVADEADMASAFAAIEETFGGVDVVVHTAGRMMLAPLIDFDLTQLDALLRTNIRGTFVVDQLAARKVRNGGAIINFSSSVVKIALPSYSAYAATKGAVDAVSLILARELRGRDVTVNAVAPGPTATPLFLNGKSEETVNNLSNMAPLQRLGTPADIAEAVSFLAGPARWVNGQTVYVNGGVI
ncbi:SDR family oxidoreductase (plasmid) [Paenarthrobacter sp. OM7]|uniref:SDR family oxidoreductase n=1 Tax=Paenarthrobacter sp. OM7 TaxID=3041264 RepID=UPI002468AAF2|nr:SDR family oxidoreductase [Paenarthrobacter sp. OM7]WGM22913.1 SDR family oxidoreductase [Paenarthrobacter sp. OM7]